MLKPFDLQAALAGAKVVTRDGREVKIAGYNEEARKDMCVVGWVGCIASVWDADGIFYNSNKKDDFLTLCMAPVERKEWVVRATINGCTFISQAFLTYEDAKVHADDIYYHIPTIHEITIHE